MTELSFLIDLLVNEKLSKTVKEKVVARIKDVELLQTATPVLKSVPNFIGYQQPIASGQSPSTIAAMQRHAAQLPQEASVELSPISQTNVHQVVADPPAQQGVVVASLAAAQAIQSRDTAVAAALSGRPEKGRTSPRKF